MKTLLALLSSVGLAATAGSIVIGFQTGVFEKKVEPFDLSTIPVEIVLNDFNGYGGVSKEIKIKSLVYKETINNPLTNNMIHSMGGVEEFKKVFDSELSIFDEKGNAKKDKLSVKEGSTYFLKTNKNISEPTFKGEIKISILRGNISVQHHYDLMNDEEKQNLSNLILGRDVLDEKSVLTKELIVKTILSDIGIDTNDTNLNVNEKIQASFSNTKDITGSAGEGEVPPILSQKLKSDSEVVFYNTYEKEDELYKLKNTINLAAGLFEKVLDLGIGQADGAKLKIAIEKADETYNKPNSSMLELEKSFETLKSEIEKFLFSTFEEPSEEIKISNRADVKAAMRLKIIAEVTDETIENDNENKEEDDFFILKNSIIVSKTIAEMNMEIEDNKPSEDQLIVLISDIWKYFDSGISKESSGDFDFSLEFELSPIEMTDLLEIIKTNLFKSIDEGKIFQGHKVKNQSKDIYGDSELETDTELSSEKQNLDPWLRLGDKSDELDNPYYYLISEFLSENRSFNTSLFANRDADNRPIGPIAATSNQQFTTLMGLYINLSAYKNGKESNFVSISNSDATIASIYFSNASINKESVIVYYG